MRILIITSCTGEKKHKPDNQLISADFKNIDSTSFNQRENELSQYITSAEQIYTGQQHKRLMKGVNALRNGIGELSSDLKILSAGYGLIPASRKIAPYECTFQGMKVKEISAWADHLNVPRDIRTTLSESYDLGLVLLGDAYLKACAFDDKIVLGGPTILFCGTLMARRLPDLESLKIVPLSNPEAKRFSCALVALKGELSQRLLIKLKNKPSIKKQLFKRNSDILSLLDDDNRKPTKARSAAKPNAKVDNVIKIPESWWTQRSSRKLHYFIPEWDDLVDPDYDFISDTHSGGTGDWSNQVYAHQMYAEPNYDGILVSRAVAEKSKKKKKRINAIGVHRFLRVPREYPIMGDCGAFDYIMEDKPPYTTEDVIDYYTRLGFDYGVSVDHLIVTATENQKQFRYKLTIQNAEDFITAHRKAGLKWTPIGALQGWDPMSYTKAAVKYVKMGYKYIALGGLVRTKTTAILDIARSIRSAIPPDTSLHLFGVARLDAIQDFIQAGIQSVDSASYLRQAWMRLHQSYASFEGPYAALRIPEAGKSFRAKHMVNHPELTDEKILKMEQDALTSVRAFAKRECSLDTCLDALLKYDQFVTKKRVNMETTYRRTLEDRPWERCECAICQKWGVEVAIFRGNNRNRRRGFHNTYVFYRLFRDVLAGKPVTYLNNNGRQMLLPFSSKEKNAVRPQHS